jgi:hypothetical protein
MEAVDEEIIVYQDAQGPSRANETVPAKGA